jgi:hypothetical protein
MYGLKSIFAGVFQCTGSDSGDLARPLRSRLLTVSLPDPQTKGGKRCPMVDVKTGEAYFVTRPAIKQYCVECMEGAKATVLLEEESARLSARLDAIEQATEETHEET